MHGVIQPDTLLCGMDLCGRKMWRFHRMSTYLPCIEVAASHPIFAPICAIKSPFSEFSWVRNWSEHQAFKAGLKRWITRNLRRGFWWSLVFFMEIRALSPTKIASASLPPHLVSACPSRSPWCTGDLVSLEVYWMQRNDDSRSEYD